ncbi:MAG: hypothetical protein LQ337_003019 [Flavoplaca oasis]|nr:MAG: hypothetical protein LQ337_003019 [Flavoplaca oasis]
MEDHNHQHITPSLTPTTHSPTFSPTSDPDIGSFATEPIVDARPSLRSRLSRLVGLGRIPRQARPKSLARLRPQPQGCTTDGNFDAFLVTDVNTDPLSHPPAPPIKHDGPLHPPSTIRQGASTFTPSHPMDSAPQFIGLEDRRNKVPIATPAFVRKANFKFSTDRTMATRGSGSGSGLLVPTGDLDDTTNGDHQSVDTRLGDDEETNVKRRGSWTSIKSKAKRLFWRKKNVKD